MNPKLTGNKGASETRHAILRKMEQLEQLPMPVTDLWEKLRKYIMGMAPRATKKVGGFGRK